MSNFFYTSFLMGGLGNQMFQIAHAYSQGLKKGMECKFKLDAYTPLQANKPTKYIDNVFRKIKFENFLNNTKTISSPWNFVEIDPPTDCNISFYGYYQSSKNFYGFDEEIKKLFEPNETFLERIYKKYPELKNKNNVSLHIRRGDYLKISNILPSISISYIEKCFSLINEYDFVFVLSDDKEWVRKNINIKNMIVLEGLEDYEELWTMSLCRINIMSNSSFSWWGAYLNKNHHKKVFVPSIWFGPGGEKNYNDIYENSWKKINVQYKNGNLIA